MCLSYTEYDNAILQQVTEATHVSIFSTSTMLHSGLKLLTSVVEHSADILADVRDFASDAFASLSLLH